MLNEVMYYGGMGTAIVMFFVSVLLFIKFKIYKVVGDVTGITAKKAIKEIRENNSKTGVKTYKTSPINSERGKITEPIEQNYETSDSYVDSKDITAELTAQETTVLHSSETNSAGYSNETTLLYPQQDSKFFSLEVDLVVINTYESI